jgi:hypothetical protein
MQTSWMKVAANGERTARITIPADTEAIFRLQQYFRVTGMASAYLRVQSGGAAAMHCKHCTHNPAKEAVDKFR